MVGFSNCKAYFSEYTTAVTIGVSSLTLCSKGASTVQAINETMDLLNITARQYFSQHGYGSWGALFSQEEFSQRQDLIPHRELAVQAGLGVIGKNFLVVTPAYGPRIHLTTVITTMPFLPDSGNADFNPCKSCTLCVKQCPTNALQNYFCEDVCTKCYTCVLVCPVGEDFHTVKQFPHLWAR